MFKLPPLPYSFNALEPYIDAKTMEIHYTKHHQGYVNKLNDALKDLPGYQDMTVQDLLCSLKDLPESVKTAVRNNGGGHYNHSLFWKWMTPEQSTKNPTGKSAEAIMHAFGSMQTFKQMFNDAAKSVFGSGWAWLSIDTDGKLLIESTSNQDSPILKNHKPILGLDVWEHAYYLHYQNRRPEYIDAWWHVINWQRVEELYIA